MILIEAIILTVIFTLTIVYGTQIAIYLLELIGLGE